MTFAPQALKETRAYLKTHTGLDDNDLGIVGDEEHRGGYHCGSDRLVANDYSNRQPRDRAGLSLAASGLDVGNFARLREMSVWLVQQCRMGASDCLDIREIIYSPDGKIVLRWDQARGQNSEPYVSGDDSHKTHTHISRYRDAEHRPFISPFRRFFEGVSMEFTQQDRNVAWATTTRADALLGNKDAAVFEVSGEPKPRVETNNLKVALNRIEAKLDRLLAQGPGSIVGSEITVVGTITKAE